MEKGEKPSGVSAIVVGRTGQMLSDLASPATATLLPRYPASIVGKSVFDSGNLFFEAEFS